MIEVLAYSIILHGMMTCDKSKLIPMEVITTVGTCVVTYRQEYYVGTPKHCVLLLSCRKEREK